MLKGGEVVGHVEKTDEYVRSYLPAGYTLLRVKPT